MRTKQLAAWSMLLTAVAVAGCGSFERDFSAAAAQPTSPGDIAGAWTGTWQSDETDHNGALRAIVTRLDDHTYLARFHATYTVLLMEMTYEYEAVLRGQVAGATFHFEGAENLGWMAGGIYRYSGYATHDEFFSTYQSKDDAGTYTLRRPTVMAGQPAPSSPAGTQLVAAQTPRN